MTLTIITLLVLFSIVAIAEITVAKVVDWNEDLNEWAIPNEDPWEWPQAGEYPDRRVLEDK